MYPVFTDLFFCIFESMANRTKLYFASDFHLGVPDYKSSRDRENRIVRWLDSIKDDAAEIYLVGDVFDFWFEYTTVIPKGYIRLQGKLAELTDAGIKVVMFKGNHDMWMFDYFTKELGIEIISNELTFENNGKKFFVHHGDGLGPGDSSYKFLKKVFRSSFCQWLFARIHPNLGIGIANRWSRGSRVRHKVDNIRKEYSNEEQDCLVSFAKNLILTEPYNYLIFGHQHLPLEVKLSNDSLYINLGEWLYYNSYAVFDGEKLELKHFTTLTGF